MPGKPSGRLADCPAPISTGRTWRRRCNSTRANLDKARRPLRPSNTQLIPTQFPLEGRCFIPVLHSSKIYLLREGNADLAAAVTLSSHFHNAGASTGDTNEQKTALNENQPYSVSFFLKKFCLRGDRSPSQAAQWEESFHLV